MARHSPLGKKTRMNRERVSPGETSATGNMKKWDTHSGYIPEQQTPLALFSKYAAKFKNTRSEEKINTDLPSSTAKHPAKLPSLNANATNAGTSAQRGDKKGREGFRTTLVNVVM